MTLTPIKISIVLLIVGIIFTISVFTIAHHRESPLSPENGHLNAGGKPASRAALVKVEINGHQYFNKAGETPQEMAKRVMDSEHLKPESNHEE